MLPLPARRGDEQIRFSCAPLKSTYNTLYLLFPDKAGIMRNIILTCSHVRTIIVPAATLSLVVLFLEVGQHTDCLNVIVV